MQYEFRTSNIFPVWGDPAPFYNGRVCGERLEKAARFSATRGARRKEV